VVYEGVGRTCNGGEISSQESVNTRPILGLRIRKTRESLGGIPLFDCIDFQLDMRGRSGSKHDSARDQKVGPYNYTVKHWDTMS
jgi:hypothetical protein